MAENDEAPTSQCLWTRVAGKKDQKSHAMGFLFSHFLSSKLSEVWDIDDNNGSQRGSRWSLSMIQFGLGNAIRWPTRLVDWNQRRLWGLPVMALRIFQFT